MYRIIRPKEISGHDISSQLISIHAMTGSEPTSRIFGDGAILFSRSLQKEALSFDIVPTH